MVYSRLLSSSHAAQKETADGQAGFTLHSSSAGRSTFDSQDAFTANTVRFIASMTKLVTSVAAMQLVEQGLLELDSDLGEIVPELSHMDVLKGFDEHGAPIFVKQKKPLTLRSVVLTGVQPLRSRQLNLTVTS
jgi:CubicO group peptidase (beta-lactamase class C family)